MLDRFEAEASPNPAPVEKIIEAFLFPMAEVASGHPQFVKLMGRMHAEGLMPSIIQRHFQPSVSRFIAALRRSLPHLLEEELYWRIHFMTGAIAHATCGKAVFPFGALDSADFRTRMGRLTAFVAGGFRAPASIPLATEVTK